MANHVYIATSLDGFIATEDGGLDWLFELPNPDGGDFGFAEFIDGIDAIVMGRITFEKVMTFDLWPYERPVFVLSRTLDSVPAGLADEVEIINGAPMQVADRLAERGFDDLYIDGGKTIQQFLEDDLIDRMIVTRIPIILGGGIPLFGEASGWRRFEHQKTEILGDAAVKSWYLRSR